MTHGDGACGLNELAHDGARMPLGFVLLAAVLLSLAPLATQPASREEEEHDHRDGADEEEEELPRPKDEEEDHRGANPGDAACHQLQPLAVERLDESDPAVSIGHAGVSEGWSSRQGWRGSRGSRGSGGWRGSRGWRGNRGSLGSGCWRSMVE